MRRLTMLTAAVAMLAPPALAHVTVQPPEAVAGGFARFVVRVPNERDDAATVKVEVQLPEALLSASFQPKAGWTRSVETKQREQAAELHGEPVTDYVASVTWEGGRIEPGEFDEFAFSTRLPDEPTTLEFPAIQTYDSGEVVNWIGPEDADEPAARVRTFGLGGGEHDQPGQLEVLAELAGDRSSAATAGEEEAADPDDDGDVTDIMAWVGAGLGALALVVALVSRRRT